MKVLIIGSGGREHAIGWKIIEDSQKKQKEIQLYFAPGNGGTAQIGENIDIKDIHLLADFAAKNTIDFTIVGPEAELAEGIVDVFQSRRLRIFGPNKKAAQLESSKVFAKDFMQKYGIKTASYKTFRGPELAKEYVREKAEYPVVIKASGLAAGKGVLICYNQDEAINAIQQIMQDKSFGDAGNEIVIEQFLSGFEVSILSIFNGKEITTFISAMDHKKIGEGDTGPNTGGMGVIVPNPDFNEGHWQQFHQDTLLPTLKGLQEEQLLFAGVIFFGLMVTNTGTYLLEYNLRMGDPETQATLPLLSSDLLEVFMAAEKGEKIELEWRPGHSCCVVMASGGYPNNFETGFEIKGLDKLDTPCFIAGAKERNKHLYTSGGRVLAVAGMGNSLGEARARAYENVQRINFDYEYYRKDIGEEK